MKSLSFILTALSYVEASILKPRAIPTKSGYTLTWSDDFTGAQGTLPSASNWLFDLGTSYPGGATGWGNGEVEVYTKNLNNIQIGPQQTLFIAPRNSKGVWTSARIETQRKDFAARTGGRLFVEARIKLGTVAAANQQGIWPAFWALGAEFRGNYTNWPSATEWDFLEVINGQNTMYSTVHCGYAPGGPCNEFSGRGNSGAAFSRGVFHTVGFQVDRSMVGQGKPGTWRDETLNWYLDGNLVFTVKGSTINDIAIWDKLAHQPHFLLLNVAVGGYWPGSPNANTQQGTGVGMEVDYVGVWNS